MDWKITRWKKSWALNEGFNGGPFGGNIRKTRGIKWPTPKI